MISIVILSLFLVACVKDKEKNVEVKSEDDKILYSMGAMFGNNLKSLNLKESEIAVLVRGITDNAATAADPLLCNGCSRAHAHPLQLCKYY